MGNAAAVEEFGETAGAFGRNVAEDGDGFFHGGAILARHPRDRNMKRLALICGTMALLVAGAGRAADLSLYALFKGKAIVQVDGNRRVLAVGDTSPEGVKLVDTDTESEEAVVEIGGRRQTLKLGVVMAAFNTGTGRESVTLYADGQGFFHADGTINGHPVRFLVDTGANTVALNSALAKSAGIDYTKGKPGFAKTASGFTTVYGVKLATIKIGEITLRNVDAGVIDGPQPDTPLLGMSFLSALEMKREGNRMELTRRY
jgi:aspartyl protease family protein